MFDAHATQRNLVAKGYSLTVDGVAGPKTFAALLLRASQRAAANVPLAPALGAELATQLDAAGINTQLRVRHFLAQAACETWGFTRMVELASGQAYEGRRDLGNTQPGDGALYKGRGLLDTTGRYNYETLERLTGIDCVNHPELLEQPHQAVQAAISYWMFKSVNVAADANDIHRVTFLVNGGYNGIADRQIYFDRLGVIQ